MKRLDDMLLFSHVVELGSFTAAANSLDTSRSLVSKRIKNLENRLGTRLLQRTTRKFSLTEAGEAYYAYCRRVAETIDEAEARLGEMSEEPRGQLKITMPMTFGVRHVAPLLPAFLERYPDISIEVVADDSFVDLVELGIDLAIRIGNLPDSTLVARRLGETRILTCASPQYFARHGRPEHPDDLRQHHCMQYRHPGQRARPWMFLVGGNPVSIPVRGRVKGNNGLPLKEAARAGLGLAQLPDFMVKDELVAGTLETVLDSYSSEPIGIHLVYPSAAGRTPKARVFASYLEEELRSSIGSGAPTMGV